MDYISYIRSKVGQEKVILNLAPALRDKKTWAIPGGAMELGESTLDTAKREFFEETGIQVEARRLLNVYSNFEEVYPNGDKVQTVVFIYEMEAVSPISQLDFHNEETLRLGFFSKEEIQDLEALSPKHRLMLDEYFTNDFKMGH